MHSLREAIELCGVRKATLAKSLGLSRAAMTRYANGERNPSLIVADKLASLIGMQLTVVSGQMKFSFSKKRKRAS